MVRRPDNLAKIQSSELSQRVCEVGMGLVLICAAACGTPQGTSTSEGAPANPAVAGTSSAAAPAQSAPTSAATTPSQGSTAATAPTTTPAAGAAGAPSMAATTPAVTPPTGAAQPATPGAAPGTTGTAPATPPAAGGVVKPTTSAECGLKTQYAGDEYCINKPDPEKGWQLHIGPENYDNVDPKYLLQPGEEITNNFSAPVTVDRKRYFYYRQFRMRPGAHHNIITATAAGMTMNPFGEVGGRRVGTTNHLIEDNPVGGIIAPENKGVGIPLEPGTNINVSLHSINTTDKPQLREIWVNFMYRPDEEVTEEVEQMFQTGDVTFQVQPREEVVLGPYTCPIEGDGRMLWFYGHRHANNVRFSAWRVRDGKKDLFYEGRNWEEPMVLEYSSTVMNPAPDTAKMIEGGMSGILDFKTGDSIEWECQIVNKTDQVLGFSNNTFTGEMCIMDAELVGANCTRGGGLPGGL
jgi:hypothetical protein